MEADNWYSVGMLGFLGYRVGKTDGVKENIRRKMLIEIFNGVLPPLNSFQYVDEWGEQKSAARLKKMANTIAAFVRNFKRMKNPHFDTAIMEWEADLKFLYDEFYVRRFGFDWPEN